MIVETDHDVYVSGPLTGLENLEELKEFYEQIGEVCESAGLTPYIPHINTDPVEFPDLSPQQVYEQDRGSVLASELVIAYVGQRSIGVGMELGFSVDAGIPVILLYQEDAVVSRFPRGMPNIQAEISFKDYPDALKQLRDVL